MTPGSVIVDMAAEQGGNCELTEPGTVCVKHGVTIIGYTDLVSRLARQSSTLYATNLFRLTEELCKTKDGNINVNMEDDAIRGLTVIKDGSITWPAPPLKPAAPAVAKPAAAVPEKKGGHGLLQFRFSEEQRSDNLRGYLVRIASRFNWWVGTLFLTGCLMFLWGIYKSG